MVLKKSPYSVSFVTFNQHYTMFFLFEFSHITDKIQRVSLKFMIVINTLHHFRLLQSLFLSVSRLLT